MTLLRNWKLRKGKFLMQNDLDAYELRIEMVNNSRYTSNPDIFGTDEDNICREANPNVFEIFNHEGDLILKGTTKLISLNQTNNGPTY